MMKYLKDYKDGDRFFDIYLCKHKVSAVTKNGKPYESVILQDKTGTIDGKIWDPNSAGIADFDALDYIEVYGDVTSFQGALQVNVKRIRKCQEEEVNPSDYLPVSKYDIEEMYAELLKYIHSIQNSYLKQIIPHLIVFKCKLLLIAHCLDLASSALPVKTAGRCYTKRRRCNHLL